MAALLGFSARNRGRSSAAPSSAQLPIRPSSIEQKHLSHSVCRGVISNVTKCITFAIYFFFWLASSDQTIESRQLSDLS